jgi:hypothetical protein
MIEKLLILFGGVIIGYLLHKLKRATEEDRVPKDYNEIKMLRKQDIRLKPRIIEINEQELARKEEEK